MKIKELFKQYFQPLTTERLFLRKLCINDTQAMHDYMSNPKSFQFIRRTPNTDISQTRTFIESIIARYEGDGDFLWGVERRNDGLFIGVMRIFDISIISKHAELVYIINPKYSGHGYATEAARAIIRYVIDNMGLIRIQARCDEENTASAKLIVKCGMRYEGLLRKAVIKHEIIRNVKLFAITDDDVCEEN